MSKLLRADFARLKTDRYFLIAVIGMAVYGIFVNFLQYRNSIQYGITINLEYVFYQEYLPIGVILAAFCSLFIGTEYSDGTIRNKLVAGCRRSEIYLSGFLTCAAAGLLMNFSYMVITAATGIPLFGFFEISPFKAAVLVLNGSAMTIAYAALFTLLAMLNQNKTLVAIIGIISTFIATFLAIFLLTRIDAPEMAEDSTFTDGAETIVHYIPNPQYLNDSQRTVYQFAADFLPTGQGLQISAARTAHLWQMPLYSMILMVGATSAGIYFFRRKDIK